MKYTKEQINKKYKGKYIDVYQDYNGLYEVRGRASSTIRENTTLGEDVGTLLEYKR